MQIKSHLLAIICASIIVLGGTYLAMNTIFAKEDGVEIDKQSEEKESELNQKSLEVKNENFKKESKDIEKEKEAQKKLLEKQREQAKQISERKRELETANLEKKKSEDSVSSKSSDTDEFEKEEISLQEREQRIIERCEIVSSNILRHQDRFIQKSTTRVNVYNKVITRLETISKKLTDSGVDTSLINTYISDIKLKVLALESSSKTYLDSFKNSAELCGKTGIKNIIETKKQDLKAVTEQDRVIRRMIRDTIVPYLKTLRPISGEQSESQTSDESTNSTSVTTPIQ